MKINIKKKVLLTVAFASQFFLVSSTRVLAAGQDVGVAIPGTDATSFTFKTYIDAIYKFSLIAGGALCVLMMIFAGYKYMTSRGESGALNEAKDIIVSTLMGAALLMLVYAIRNIAKGG